MSDPTYRERERGYLIGVVLEAYREGDLRGRRAEGNAVFRKSVHMADVGRARGFVHGAAGRDDLAKIIHSAEREWYSIMRPDAEGRAVPPYGEHMADAILRAGFGYRKKGAVGNGK